MRRLPKNLSGFTLVELSIVLVILGLLVGGVLTGQSLIRASELRSITTQYQSYITAVNAFRDKYFAIPGDMANATSFWGQAASGTTCVTTAGTGTQTCNGNGDGLLTPSKASTNAVPGGATSNEIFRFWQQLSITGLISGTYSGITQGSTAFSATTANVPAGKIQNTVWFLYDWGPLTTEPGFFDGNYAATLEYGSPAANADPSVPPLKPEEAWNIDTKIDDGKPATGKLKMRAPTMSQCTDTSTTSTMTANYLLSNTGPSCLLLFPNIF